MGIEIVGSERWREGQGERSSGVRGRERGVAIEVEGGLFEVEKKGGVGESAGRARVGRFRSDAEEKGSVVGRRSAPYSELE